MKIIGIIGLGDTGGDLAKNLMASEFPVFGLDLKPKRETPFTDMGGTLVDIPRATLTVKKMGEGQLAPLFASLADSLRRDSYDGVISFESVYHPGNGNFDDGFRQSIGPFKDLFGDNLE